MPTLRRLFAPVLILAATTGVACAAGGEASVRLPLASSPRIFVTLTPTAAEASMGPGDHRADDWPALNFPLQTVRRNRLEFAIVRQGFLTGSDRLQLRLASDAHVFAQLLSGGRFSEADDSWIAVLGLASRVRLSYTNGPWDLSVSARRRLGDSDVRARLSYRLRF